MSGDNREQQILKLLASITSVKSKTPKEGTEALTKQYAPHVIMIFKGQETVTCLAFTYKKFHRKLACKCMYVRIRKPISVKKKAFFYIKIYLNISSPCSQHSGVPDFLITAFQSTSYEFVLVQHVSNPMVSGHRSYLMGSPLVFNRRVQKIK